MKRIAQFIVSAIVLVPILSSCQKEKEPQTKDTVTVATQPSGIQSANEGAKRITIWPTAHWEATCDVQWIKVKPSSGERGTQEVVLEYEENFTGETRVGVVTFTARQGSDTYTLTQNF